MLTPINFNKVCFVEGALAFCLQNARAAHEFFMFTKRTQNKSYILYFIYYFLFFAPVNLTGAKNFLLTNF